MPKISIVIPVYNAEKFLNETLNSVANQTFTDFECVIVNDGSMDNSLEIINSFIEKDDRFKCLTISNSGCANIPRNIAVDNSSSGLIFNLDADDVIDLDCLEKMYNRQQTTNSDIVLLQLIGYKRDLEGELYRLPLSDFDKNKIYTGKEACSLTIGGWKITCSGMLTKKSLYEGVPIGKLMNSDELTSRYLLYSADIVAVTNTNYHYRNLADSISKGISIKLFDKLIVDSQLDDFIIARYSETSEVPKRMRNARLFNLIYLYSDFKKYTSCFSKLQRKQIKEIFRKSYFSQNFVQLKKELPKHLGMMFLTSFQLFKINAAVYVFLKKMKGSNYILK